MSEIKTDKLTGVGTAGVILVTGEGNSTTTSLQQGLAKVAGTFDNVNATLVSSFNVTSGTDSGTGDATFNITNALSSTSDRTIVWGAWNTTDGGTSGASGNSTGGLTCCQVSVAPSASSVRGRVVKGSSSSSDGTAIDVSAMNMVVHGGLA